MTNSMPSNMAELLEKDLTALYGPVISNDNLRVALGFTSMEAFRQALARKTVQIPVFGLPNRRGKYALVKDVAHWLAIQRETAAQQMGARGTAR